jgi:hypothetical protein
LRAGETTEPEEESDDFLEDIEDRVALEDLESTEELERTED